MENENPQVITPNPEEPQTPENGEGKPETVDYKAELEKVKKQLGQAEHVILKLKSEKDEEPLAGDEDNPESPAEIARKEAGKILANVFSSQAKSIARSLSANEDEAELIMFHYKNTITPTGDIETDIRRAKLIANEGRISKDLDQARRSALSKELKGTQGGEGGQKPPMEEGPPPMDDKSKKLLAGFKWDSKRKGWVGPSGRFHSLAEIQTSTK